MSSISEFDEFENLPDHLKEGVILRIKPFFLENFSTIFGFKVDYSKYFRANYNRLVQLIEERERELNKVLEKKKDNLDENFIDEIYDDYDDDISNYKKMYQELMRFAGYIGDEESVNMMAPLLGYGDAILGAAEGKQLKLIRSVAGKGAPMYDYWAMSTAVTAGDSEIFKEILDQTQIGDFDYSSFFKISAEKGNRYILELLLSKALKNKQLLRNSLSDLYRDTLIGASRGGHIDIVHRMLRMGSGNDYRAFFEAVQNDHPKIVKVLLDYQKGKGYWGEIKVNHLLEGIAAATESGNPNAREIIEYLIEFMNEENLELSERLEIYYDSILESAKEKNFTDIVQLLQNLNF